MWKCKCNSDKESETTFRAKDRASWAGEFQFLVRALFCVLPFVLSGIAQAGTPPLVPDLVVKTGVYAGRADQFKASTTDASGNLYLTGTTSTPANGLNFVTVKMDAAGQILWTAEYDGAAGQDDTARAITVDTQGDVYVTGNSVNARGDTDLVVVHYNSSGQFSGNWAGGSGKILGVRTFDGNAQSYDDGVMVKVDANGFVYVVGSSVGDGTFNDIVLIKYNQLGDLLWRVVYDGPGHFSDSPVFLKLMPGGNVLVGGESTGGNEDSDWTFLLYDQNGNRVESWADNGVLRFDFATGSYDLPTDAVIDANGDIFVAGTVLPPGGNTDMALIRINSGGTVAWSVYYDGPASGTDQTAAIVQDTNGDLIVAGTSQGAGTGNDIVLLRYTSNGLPSTLWPDQGDGMGVRRYTSDGENEDQAATLKSDAQGNLDVGGFTFDATTQYDFLIPVFSRRGELWGVGRYDGGTTESERIVNLQVDNASHVYALGTLFGNEGDNQLLTVRFGVKPLFDITAGHQMSLAGKPVTFAITPPAGNFSYQWQRNGLDINLAQSASYQLPVAALESAGDYFVTVSNAYGSMNYPVSELTVTSLAWSSGSGTTVFVAGRNGAGIVVDYTDTLSNSISWTALSSLTLGTGTASVRDGAAASQNTRFYRVRRIDP
jgi:uncharacterized delta-60 repeat protein